MSVVHRTDVGDLAGSRAVEWANVGAVGFLSPRGMTRWVMHVLMFEETLCAEMVAMAKRPEYQKPPIDLRDVVWTAGKFTPLQLFRVAAWKSARGLAPLTLNTEQDITDRTSGALDAIRHWRGVDVLLAEVDWDDYEQSVATAVGTKGKSGLLALSGFGYPMASAFLALLAPEAFPVIDRWTVKAVYDRDTMNGMQKAAVYTHFARRLAEIAPRYYPDCSTVHKVDQTVMDAAMGWARQEAGCTPVPFKAVAVPTT